MKLEIDTTKKTICILEETSILEVLNFLKSLESEDYKIISKHTVSIVEKENIKRGSLPIYPTYPPVEYPPYNPYNPLSPIWVYDPNSQPLYQPTTC